jgi:adenosine deaminase
MHDETVVHVEMALSPLGFTRRGLDIKAGIAAVASAFREARDNFGMTGGIIAGCQRDRLPAEALGMLNELRACGDDILAVGLHGAEQGNAPVLFEQHFAFARAQGWHTVAHAGEEGPADYVTQAIDILGVERIDHGVRADEDPALIDRLAAEGIPLTVCPLSNVCLGVFATLGEHNIARLLRSGIAVSLHSDDPAYFGGLSLALPRTNRQSTRSLSCGNSRNEQERHPGRLPGPHHKGDTSRGIRRHLGGRHRQHDRGRRQRSFGAT